MDPRSLLRQLTRVPLEKPCDTPWESMAGGEKVRHCAACDRDVYSLSEMTELEAELRLLNSGEAVPCVRYARDADGNVLHRPPPRRVLLSLPSARALVVASALGGSALAQEKDKEPVQCVMLNAPEAVPGGAMAAPLAPAAGAAAPAPAAPAPPRPIPLAGAPPPPRQPIPYGTLTVRSKTPRDVEVQGIKLKAPLAEFRLTPGNFVLKVDGKKKRTVSFTIKLNQQTTIDLDKK
jgi:hypothetical protein